MSNDLESIDRIIASVVKGVQVKLDYHLDKRTFEEKEKREPFYVFCQKCNDMYKVKKLWPCPKLVMGCDEERVCPKCGEHLDKPPLIADTQEELRKTLQEKLNNV